MLVFQLVLQRRLWLSKKILCNTFLNKLTKQDVCGVDTWACTAYVYKICQFHNHTSSVQHVHANPCTLKQVHKQTDGPSLLVNRCVWVMQSCYTAKSVHLPRVRTMGHRQSLVRDIAKLWIITGLKFRSFGYRSIGLSVPDVITTDWKRSKTGLIAREASRQLSCKTTKKSELAFSKNNQKLLETERYEIHTKGTHTHTDKRE